MSILELLWKILNLLGMDIGRLIKILSFLGDLLADESKHCFLGFLGGVSAYLLTWIISSALLWVLRRLTRYKVYMAAGWRTIILSLPLIFAFAALSHALLDGFFLWYTMPQSPHLELIK